MRPTTLRIALLAAAMAATALSTAHPVQACGGCFSPPSQTTVVTGHRMVFSISQEQTVLWDQIQYSGSPQDFAWILPVHAGATLQLSHDEFFAALDAVTDPVITGPSPNCGGNGGSSGGIGCGSSASSSALAGAEDGSGSSVQVISQSVVGPYDTVTLQSSDPNALYDWLNANGYDTPDTTRPLIDAYVQAGFDFLALRLAPGQGVQAMQPVRVVSAGASLALPLRMVAAGAGAEVDLTLYVLGEGRYETQSFPNTVVDASKLTWDAATSQSNYETLASQLMASNGGTWLTEFAEPEVLSGSWQSYQYDSSCYAYGGNLSCYGTPTLASAYYGQCVSSTPQPCTDGGSTCVEDACAAFDDLSVALVGMTPNSTWVTRLRTSLPPAALTAGDLVLQASAGQTPVSNRLSTSTYSDPSYDPCPGSHGGCSAVAEDPGTLERWLVVGTFAFAGLALVRRRRRA